MWPDYNPEQPTYTLRERETQPYRCGLISLVLPLLLSLSLSVSLSRFILYACAAN